MTISYGKQTIGSKDIRAVSAAMKSERLTQGPRVPEFEKRFADFCGAKYAVAVSTGTAALHLAYLAAGLKAGDEFVTSPITFLATANAGVYAGARPVFSDVSKETALLDPEILSEKTGKRIKLAAPVHYTGAVCDMQAIQAIAKKRNWFVVEDACHALGAHYKGKPIGSCSHSDMAIFSFHPVKSITTGEGGMITTSSREAYEKLLSLRSHGMVYGDKRKTIKDPWAYEMQFLGFNYRITDIQCALGIEQLKKLPDFIKKRRSIAAYYLEALAAVPGLKLPPQHQLNSSAWHLFVIRLTGPDGEQKRLGLYEALKERSIQAQVHYIPVYWQPYYEALGYRRGLCPNAEEAYRGLLSLPIYPKLPISDARRVARAIKEFMKR